MKRLTLRLFLIIASISTLGCIKNDDVIFTGRLAEIDQTTYNANASGLTYPILTRVPAMGRAVAAICPDSVLRKFSGTLRLRINLVGAQSSKDETVGYTTFATPIDTVSFPATIAASASAGCPAAQSPARVANPKLPVTNAVAGTNFNFLGTAGKITIPANSSFGYLEIQLINGAVVNGGAFIGIQLDATGSIPPNINYSQIGFVVDLR